MVSESNSSQLCSVRDVPQMINVAIHKGIQHIKSVNTINDIRLRILQFTFDLAEFEDFVISTLPDNSAQEQQDTPFTSNKTRYIIFVDFDSNHNIRKQNGNADNKIVKQESKC